MKNLDSKKANEMLRHAIFHCKWGSESVDRPAAPADNEAAEILERCRQMILKDRLAFEIAKGLNTGK